MRQKRLWIYVVAGVSAAALVALVVLATARTVQADASVPRVAISAPPVQGAAGPTPVVKPVSAARNQPATPKDSSSPEAKQWKDKIHGVASWYGGVFNGRKTASGEIFDMNAMTACHPSLPFGSIVRVINRSNHRSVVVRINDRGDLVEEGRVIDLSYAAAQKLGMTWSGLAKVDLEVLSLGKPHEMRASK